MAVSREDIEAKAAQIMDVVDETKASARDTAVLAGVAVAAVVAIAFVMGRKRGRKNKALVEVYKV